MPQALLAFIILFLSAALLRASNLLDRSHAERLAALVFSISLPATILVSLVGSPIMWGTATRSNPA